MSSPKSTLPLNGTVQISVLPQVAAADNQIKTSPVSENEPHQNQTKSLSRQISHPATAVLILVQSRGGNT